ncbi:MAG: Gfo/Idh/MocA family oxidoreductase [Lachnospiraceae bacterium]|nr:Gfo/Idh/MocA family oxidoreductase [Lachnospiraceae bacterium]
MNIGILGAGSIASIFADMINHIDEANAYAVAARDIERANAFKDKFSFEKAYGSYEEMLSDPNVELVYIATPHSHHAEHAKLCIEYGKPVLCEKAFTVNREQAEEVFALAKEKGVFVAEAIWTRYMPSRKVINEIIESGIIGDIKTITANLCYPISSVERIVKPELAGGALLDVGVYCLNFAVMHKGNDIVSIESAVSMEGEGEGQETIKLFYDGGTMAVLTSCIYGRSDRKGIFYGEKGYIIVENINNPGKISVFDTDDKLLKEVVFDEIYNGYEYELLECMKCIKEGKLEPDSMPHDDTLFIMHLMDTIRDSWEMKYPME